MKKVTTLFAATVILFALAVFNSCDQKNATQNEIITVGVVAPLSGTNASYGDILRQGFDLAFASDSLLKLKYEDSKFDPTTTVTAFNKLISIHKVKVVLGEVASGNTLAIAPVAEKNKVVLFSTISSSDDLKNAGDYFFRNIPRNDVQGRTVAEFLFKKLNISSAAIYGLNDAYGTNISKSFKEIFIGLGGKINFEGSHEKGQLDFKTALAKIKSSGAKALFIPGDKNEPAGILRQAKELNLNIPIIGGDGSSNADVIAIAGNASEGFYCSNVLVDKSSAYYQNYHKMFVQTYQKEPGAYDAYAYEGAMIILEAVQHSGNDADKVKEYLYTHTFPSMTGDLKFDKDGEVDRLWGMYQVVDGKFVEVE